MANTDVFSLTEGPYIPSEHSSYGLLPNSRKHGGEVFSYPSELGVIDDLISKYEDNDETKERVARLIPYGMKSYSEYFSLLADYAKKYREKDIELSGAIEWVAAAVRRMNVKEDWSIVRYVGHEFDDDDFAEYSELTRGRCYYWPCSKEKPVYEGVIDNEEFTSYLYPCTPESWEIVSDPTGMATRALAGEADDAPGWKIELENDPNSIEAWAKELGVSAKMEGKTPVFEDDLDVGWSLSETEPATFKCPTCGKDCNNNAYTLVNARHNPELRDMLINDTLFEITCPACGETSRAVNPCLYLDPTHLAVAYLVLDEEMAAGVTELFDSLSKEGPPMDRSVKRIVFNIDDLREKAVIFEAGLDDRVLELLKVPIIGSAKSEHGVADDAVCVVHFVEQNEEALEFSFEAGEDHFSASMPLGGYQLYKDAIANSSISSDQSYLVDRSWAYYALDILFDEGAL